MWEEGRAAYTGMTIGVDQSAGVGDNDGIRWSILPSRMSICQRYKKCSVGGVGVK